MHRSMSLLHQGGGLLHFVAVSKAREEGGELGLTLSLVQAGLTLALGVPFLPREKAAKALDSCCLSLFAPVQSSHSPVHHEYLYYHVYLMPP